MISKKQIDDDIKKVQETLCKRPTQREYIKFGIHHMRTIIKYYGSWSNALQVILGERIKKNLEISHMCKNCDNITTNPKFCSSKCSTSYNSKKENGRKNGRQCHNRYCKICNELLPPNKTHVKCKKCKNKIKTVNGDYIDIEHVTKAMLSTKDSQKYRKIRSRARKIAQEHGKLDKCEICEYSKHVECAHVRPIQCFSDDEKITTINNPKNLRGLCPNHHWEFENNLLEI